MTINPACRENHAGDRLLVDGSAPPRLTHSLRNRNDMY